MWQGNAGRAGQQRGFVGEREDGAVCGRCRGHRHTQGCQPLAKGHQCPTAPGPGAVTGRICFLPLLLLVGTRVAWQWDGNNPSRAPCWSPATRGCCLILCHPEPWVCSCPVQSRARFLLSLGTRSALPAKSRESWSARRGGYARRGHWLGVPGESPPVPVGSPSLQREPGCWHLTGNGVSGDARELGKAQQSNQQDLGPGTKEKSSVSSPGSVPCSVGNVLCQKESPSCWLGSTSV